MTGIAVRPLAPSDRRALLFGFAHLSDRSRYQRFLGAVPELRGSQLERLMAVDHWHHEALVAWATGPRRPVAVARYVRAEGDFDLAEVAVAVCDDWQRRGIGRLLAAELGAAARRAGIRSFAGTLLADNRAALRLAAGLGRPVVRGRGDVLEFRVALPAGR
jgi:GNAT superfamily N-acetyltransferase